MGEIPVGGWAAVCDAQGVRDRPDLVVRAIGAVAAAIVADEDGERLEAVRSVVRAGAWVRLWHGSMVGGPWSEPDDLHDSFPGFTDSLLLLAALGAAQRAAVHSSVPIVVGHLEMAGAALQVWWERNTR